MPYSLDEFFADMATFPEVNSSEWDLPDTEWPKIHLTDTKQTLVIPMNNVMSRTMLYFFDKYGRERGADNATRFHLVADFCARHRKRLLQAGLVINNPDDTVGVRTSFIRFLLDGFREPVPPVIFGKHVDANKNGDLSYRKVMKKWQNAKQQYAPDRGKK
jgi:hypothetical protein